MNSRNWEKALIRNRLGFEAEFFAQEMGLNYAYASWTVRLSGDYLGRSVDELLQSPDFCYSVLLLSASMLEINDSRFCCERNGEEPYLDEVPLLLERFYTIARAIESIAARKL